jgi:hypothetical protein
MLAGSALSRKIVDDPIWLSRPFGTTIERRNGVAKVVLTPES